MQAITLHMRTSRSRKKRLPPWVVSNEPLLPVSSCGSRSMPDAYAVGMPALSVRSSLGATGPREPQVLGLEHLRHRRVGHRTLDHVAELPHVAGPRVTAERALRVGAE